MLSVAVARQYHSTSEAQAEVRLLGLLADGHEKARERLAFFRHHFLPEVPSYITNNCALEVDGDWHRKKERRGVTASLLLAHFDRQLSLGGIFADSTRVLCIDVDNQAGKVARRNGGPVELDPDLSARRRLVELIAPMGVWVCSSASHGLHRWVLLKDPVPLEQLAPLVRERMCQLLPQVKELYDRPFIRESILHANLDGVAGYIELLPYQRPGGQGRVIRAPLGPGSAVITDQGHVLTQPGKAIQYLMDHLTPVTLTDLCPGNVRTQLPLELEGFKAKHLPARGKKLPARALPRDLRARLLMCDGRQPEHLRPDRDTYLRTMSEVRREGMPVGTRHHATHLLALRCKWEGMPEDQALQDLEEWLTGPAYQASREAQRNLEAARRKTRSVVRYIYRPDAPNGGKRRWRDPEPLRKGDLLRLEQVLGSCVTTLNLAIKVLGFARANGYREIRDGALLCELPTREIGVRTRRMRSAFQDLIDKGLLRLRRNRLPKRDEDHPRGPQRARPWLFEVRWEFSPFGAPISSWRSIAARERTQLLTALQGTSDSATTGRACYGGNGYTESVPVHVDGTGPSASEGTGACGTRETSEGGFEDPLVPRAEDTEGSEARQPLCPPTGEGDAVVSIERERDLGEDLGDGVGNETKVGWSGGGSGGNHRAAAGGCGKLDRLSREIFHLQREISRADEVVGGAARNSSSGRLLAFRGRKYPTRSGDDSDGSDDG